MRDTRSVVHTPEGITFELDPAGPVTRLVASVIDLFCQATLLVIVFTVLAVLRFMVDWLLLLSVFTITWFYPVACEMLLKGRSPGKIAFGLQVVMDDGSHVTLSASLIRNLVRFADSIMGLGFFIALAAPDFRRGGDLVAGTLVVYRESLGGLRSTAHNAPRRHQPRPEATAPCRPDPLPPMGPELSDLVLALDRRIPRLDPSLALDLARRTLEACGADKSEAPLTRIRDLAMGIQRQRSIGSWGAH